MLGFQSTTYYLLDDKKLAVFYEGEEFYVTATQIMQWCNRGKVTGGASWPNSSNCLALRLHLKHHNKNEDTLAHFFSADTDSFAFPLPL